MAHWGNSTPRVSTLTLDPTHIVVGALTIVGAWSVREIAVSELAQCDGPPRYLATPYPIDMVSG